MNMNEENKTENPESGIQTYDRKKKSHGNFLKIGCASCGFVVVVALCVLSSRYSWFGVKADDEGISYSNGSESSYSTTAPVEEQKVPTKANKHNETQETTAATSATTTAKTTQTTAATTKATAPATTKATTPATTAAPKPAWTEKKCNGTMYINISSCSARKEGLQGAEVVSYKYYGDAVNIAALTDTGYYKLDDGTYIHSDYLSESKPVATTVPKAAKPTVQDNATPAPVITDSPVNCTAEEAEVFRIVMRFVFPTALSLINGIQTHTRRQRHVALKLNSSSAICGRTVQTSRPYTATVMMSYGISSAPSEKISAQVSLPHRE